MFAVNRFVVALSGTVLASAHSGRAAAYELTERHIGFCWLTQRRLLLRERESAALRIAESLLLQTIRR